MHWAVFMKSATAITTDNKYPPWRSQLQQQVAVLASLLNQHTTSPKVRNPQDRSKNTQIRQAQGNKGTPGRQDSKECSLSCNTAGYWSLQWSIPASKWQSDTQPAPTEKLQLWSHSAYWWGSGSIPLHSCPHPVPACPGHPTVRAICKETFLFLPSHPKEPLGLGPRSVTWQQERRAPPRSAVVAASASAGGTDRHTEERQRRGVSSSLLNYELKKNKESSKAGASFPMPTNALAELLGIQEAAIGFQQATGSPVIKLQRTAEENTAEASSVFKCK